MTSPMTLNSHKIGNYILIVSLKRESISQQSVNRISGSRLLISSLPGCASFDIMFTRVATSRLNKRS